MDTKLITAHDMGGQIELHFKECEVISERAEMSASASSQSTATTSGNAYAPAGRNTAVSMSQHLQLDSQLQIQTETSFKYWVKWQDGKEELITLPLTARPTQRIVMTYAKQTSKVGASLKLNGKDPVFTFDSDSDPGKLIGAMNRDTGEVISMADRWVSDRTSSAFVKDLDTAKTHLSMGSGTAILAAVLLGLPATALAGVLTENGIATLLIGIVAGVVVFTRTLKKVKLSKKSARELMAYYDGEKKNLSALVEVELKSL